jgi:cation/acetate symporter
MERKRRSIPPQVAETAARERGAVSARARPRQEEIVPMSTAMYERMRSNPKFQNLVRTRGRFAWTLAITVLTIFYGFVMLVAFQPDLLGRPVAEGSALTVGVAFGLFMFVFFWVLTAAYVRRANGAFDTVTEEVVNEARLAEHAAHAPAARREVA